MIGCLLMNTPLFTEAVVVVYDRRGPVVFRQLSDLYGLTLDMLAGVMAMHLIVGRSLLPTLFLMTLGYIYCRD